MPAYALAKTETAPPSSGVPMSLLPQVVVISRGTYVGPIAAPARGCTRRAATPTHATDDRRPEKNSRGSRAEDGRKAVAWPDGRLRKKKVWAAPITPQPCAAVTATRDNLRGAHTVTATNRRTVTRQFALRTQYS